MTGRLPQAYKALGLLPEGVPINKSWLASPPCAGLRDMTRHLREERAANPVVKIDDEFMDFYNHQVTDMSRRYQRASQVLGHYYQGPPG
eukprot:12931155-Prorocentrum_lima.AAC.1